VNTTRGEHLVQELLWVHGILRSDLATVSRLAEEVLGGRTPEDVRADIALLKTQSPLWQLKVNCLYYCRFVHAHHSGEDAHVFPALRRSNPALETVVDKLEADHRKVSDILDEVEQSSDDLVHEDTPERRQHVVSALHLLTEHLLTHLDYEEEAISPTLRSWDRWPFF
jgi:iron-sulfur cluster repair protein YtfE (RIC family)